jgi:hypothetical protein
MIFERGLLFEPGKGFAVDASGSLILERLVEGVDDAVHEDLSHLFDFPGDEGYSVPLNEYMITVVFSIFSYS